MEIPLTNSTLKLIVDDEDADRVLAYKWYLMASGYSRSTTTHNNKRWPNGKYVVIARLIMGHAPIGYEWDHADRNKLNNRKSNLRLSTRSQNSRNIPVRKNAKSGFKGVTITQSGKWCARIQIKENKRIHLGCFVTKEDAARAYDAEAKKQFGEFAYTNF